MWATVKAQVAHSFCIAWLLALLLFTQARAEDSASPSVAAIAFGKADRAVVDIVEDLGIPVARRELAGEPLAGQVLVSARSLEEPVVLWVDSASSSISVLRTTDGTILSRQVARKTFVQTPYVAALAATELLELMRKTPEARVEAPKPSIDETRPSYGHRRWGAVASLGAELAAGARHGPALFRPMLSVDVSYELAAPWFADVGVASAPFGTTVQPLPRGDDGRVRYHRTDLGLRLGLGLRKGETSFVAHVSPGVGFLSAEARGIDDARARTKRRTQLVLGGGLLLRSYVWERVGVTLGLDVAWLTSPARYLADGTLVLREAPFRVAASLGLLLRLR